MVKDTKLYELLNVAPDAEPDVIRRGYYKQARRWHPDKCPDDPDAEARFKDISEAYAVLSDPQRRAVYDERGAEGVNEADGAPGPEEVRAELERLARTLFGGGAFETILGDVATLAVFERVLDDLAAVREGRIAGSGAAEAAAEAANTERREEEEEERCVNLAIILIAKLKFYVRGEVQAFREVAEAEAEFLMGAPGGDELLELVSTVYIQEGRQHLGRFMGVEGFFSEVLEKGRRIGQSFALAGQIAKLSLAQKRMERHEIERIKREELGGDGGAGTDKRANRTAARDATNTDDDDAGAGTGPGASRADPEAARYQEQILERGLEVSWRLGKFLLEARLRRVCEITLAGSEKAPGGILPRDVREARAAACIQIGEIYERIRDRVLASDNAARREGATAPIMKAMREQMHPTTASESESGEDGK